MSTAVKRRIRTTALTAGPALMLIMAAAVPAQAAGIPAEAAAENALSGAITPDVSVAKSAGTSYATAMLNKLGRQAHLERVAAQLPTLRQLAAARATEADSARKAQTATAASVTRASTADTAARAKLASAKRAVTLAKKTLTAAKKQRPYSSTRVAKATKAKTTAENAVRTRAATVTTTASALSAARKTNTTAVGTLNAATATYQSAAKKVSNAQLAIKAWPAERAALAAQAASLSQQVVTQSRTAFSTVNVYGVTVNRVVAYQFQHMIDDAAKAGVKLSGGGFRTKQQQIALRTANGCPDVWTAPASSCRVPTAIPGRSLHEVGLAIDMTADGKSMNTRKSAGFKWMAAHAGNYGFVNLPSEPWHWSITGG
ncbi:D-alanyl-D-alanine carboxypeptidase [Actinoplanes lutulentus]|uniref:M15 family metallopeptidase n=1 Tax=Actinoplanes lutulentus TaxID=1287878 RepID=UPI0011B9384F|nr:M15 family metallopeptidase [Actinoplanes lutulentus]MBB2948963.1 D-alanyl-D-alanine carboxypeptidase [Actinoplanes lutulentus]